MGSVIMLSGPIGAGKTTVARELVAMMSGEVGYIEGDDCWRFLAKSQRDRRENFSIIMRSMTAASLPLARSGYDVVLDFTIPAEFLPTAQKILKDVPIDFVNFQPSLSVCEHRAANRAEGVISDYSVYRDFYELFERVGERFCIREDTADATVVASRILEGLKAGTFRVA
jgi:predicted kinase